MVFVTDYLDQVVTGSWQKPRIDPSLKPGDGMEGREKKDRKEPPQIRRAHQTFAWVSGVVEGSEHIGSLLAMPSGICLPPTSPWELLLGTDPGWDAHVYQR